MKFQLLIAHYKEEQWYIERLLDSLKLQQGVDFNEVSVIIFNDGDDVVLDTSKWNYPFKVDYRVEPWGDISYARHQLLEFSEAEYVMFSDGDDLFYRNNALWDIFKHIDEKHPDIITSQFTEDVLDQSFSKIIYFYNHNNDNVWTHGKIYRRQFLIDNAIQWSIPLKHFYEDSYFVRLCFALTENKVNIDETIWWWKSRDNSLVRTDYGWVDKTYVQKIESNEALVKSLLEKGQTDTAAHYAYVQIYEGYFTLIQPKWNTEPLIQYKPAMEEKMKEYILKYSKIALSINQESKNTMMGVLIDRFYKNINRSPADDISFQEWLDKLLNK